ncbi:MAG: hypothetical protein QOE61_4543, partial [Micromonosporaceae bacterium]|nr:hypothetical protein [Micromonosporaceae bacterium]
MTGGTDRGRRRRIGRIAVAVLGVLAVGAAAAAAAGFGVPYGEGSGPAPSVLPPATATVTVTRQTLVDTQSEDGELGYGAATSVTGRLGGTVTALPATGSTLKRGQALYHVDN